MDVSKKCFNSEITMVKNFVLQNIVSDVNINIENVIRVLSEKKTILPNLRIK